MSNERFAQALARIGDAAARIEAGLAAATPDAALAERHARLRDEAIAVLARLDRLIAGGGASNGAETG